MSTLSDYLAKNYLNADPKPAKKSKKRKRKDKDGEVTGLVVADDDVTGWDNNGQDDDEDDYRGPVMGMFQLHPHTRVLFLSGATFIWLRRRN
jgi:pre-mRNA-splicing factor CWC26